MKLRIAKKITGRIADGMLRQMRAGRVMLGRPVFRWNWRTIDRAWSRWEKAWH